MSVLQASERVLRTGEYGVLVYQIKIYITSVFLEGRAQNPAFFYLEGIEKDRMFQYDLS